MRRLIISIMYFSEAAESASEQAVNTDCTSMIQAE